jgi:RNA polymerase sigma factor (sigma-70 family)
LLVYLYKHDSVESPEKWLLGTLRNRCLGYWRERRRRLYTALDQALLENVAATKESPQEALDLQRDVRSLLTQLPARCRNLLTLRYQEGCDAPETARRLGYKASGIYKVTERCLAALTRQMVACGIVERGQDD